MGERRPRGGAAGELKASRVAGMWSPVCIVGELRSASAGRDAQGDVPLEDSDRPVGLREVAGAGRAGALVSAGGHVEQARRPADLWAVRRAARPLEQSRRPAGVWINHAGKAGLWSWRQAGGPLQQSCRPAGLWRCRADRRVSWRSCADRRASWRSCAEQRASGAVALSSRLLRQSSSSRLAGPGRRQSCRPAGLGQNRAGWRVPGTGMQAGGRVVLSCRQCSFWNWRAGRRTVSAVVQASGPLALSRRPAGFCAVARNGGPREPSH